MRLSVFTVCLRSSYTKPIPLSPPYSLSTASWTLTFSLENVKKDLTNIDSALETHPDSMRSHFISMEYFHLFSQQMPVWLKAASWTQSCPKYTPMNKLIFLFTFDSSLYGKIPHPTNRLAAAASFVVDLERIRYCRSNTFNHGKSCILTLSLWKDHQVNPPIHFLTYLSNAWSAERSLRQGSRMSLL